jgi:hypothetical protein
LRWIGCALLVVSATACGSRAGSADIERTFPIEWHDHASSIDVGYTVSQLVFHGGRWSARISVHNASQTPLYEVAWSTDSSHVTWNGPALVFSGLDVLGNRRLIYFPADTEKPTIPLPLKAGATWRGTVGGPIPDKPALPRGRPIWIRYPMFGIGRVWDGFNAATAVQWISNRGVTL